MKRGVNMVSIKHQDLQLPGKPKNPKFLNWTLQILLSISIFPFLLLCSLRLLIYLNSLHFLFSTYISDFFSYYINRQFMFILFNVILVFVTQGFGLFGRSASMTVTHDDLHDEFDMKNRDYRRPTLDIVEMQVGVGDEEGMADSVGTLIPVEKEGDGYDGGDDNEMVTGESDKKFEEFIKKMKEKMRTEALQQVLVV